MWNNIWNVVGNAVGAFIGGLIAYQIARLQSKVDKQATMENFVIQENIKKMGELYLELQSMGSSMYSMKEHLNYLKNNKEQWDSVWNLMNKEYEDLANSFKQAIVVWETQVYLTNIFSKDMAENINKIPAEMVQLDRCFQLKNSRLIDSKIDAEIRKTSDLINKMYSSKSELNRILKDTRKSYYQE